MRNRIVTGAVVAFALALTPLLAIPADDVWLVVGERVDQIELRGALVVEFAGSGSLVFGAERHRVSLPGAARLVVDGRPATPGGVVHRGQEVRVEAGGGSWTIRLVDDEARALAGRGTRIEDDRPDKESRFDSDRPTRFYLKLDRQGGSLFFYPESDG